MELLKKENHFQVQTKGMEIKKDENGKISSIVLEGYASTKNKDRVNDIVLPSAFEKALDLYMKNPRVFLQHDSSKNVGKTIEAKINAKGLLVKTEIMLNISLDGTDEIRLFEAIEKGLYKTYSIGYKVNEIEEKEVKQDGKVVGYEWIIKDLDLMEISLVSVPANPYALIKSIEDCMPEGTKLDKEEGIDQLKEMTGEAEVVKELTGNVTITKEGKEEIEEEEIEDEIEEKEAAEVESTVEEVIESENEIVDEDTTKVEENIEKVEEIEVKEETKTEETPKEEIQESQDAENDVEITSNGDEKNSVVEEIKEIEIKTKEMEIKTKEMEVETKSFVEIKEFEEKIEKMSEYSKKEVLELRSDIKEVSDGFLDIINQFKELKEYTKTLEDVMSKVVIKKGYTYEKVSTPQRDVFGKAIDLATGRRN